ncbi:hypothetical protein WHR41_06880 [Cladosporium halotolerans]|uniref:Auxiliary Activity family 9 catalytic domain-containing protein n=1 Tax=Cladosporium halotolerans TaxID=1052096 RepID=A0AB34KN20_9PEZI
MPIKMNAASAAAVFAALAAVPAVSAHGYVESITADGKTVDGTSPNWIYNEADTPGWYAKNQDNGFVAPDSYSNGDIICHKEATPGQTSVQVKAGSDMTLKWNTWPESHHGPVIDYLAKCPGDCTAVDKESLKFFKLDAQGVIDAASNQWATDKLIGDDNSWTLTIPESLAAGHYVLRHEIIALHSASQENGAQNYPQCINIEVTGSGSTDPCSGGADCVAGTALYTPSDEGIQYNIYGGDIASYPIPGPKAWSAGAAKLKRAIARAFSA